jgi:hypothetical protein
MAVEPQPEIFAPGVISGPANDAAPTFTPDGKTVCFFRNNGINYDVLVSHLTGAHWAAPVIAPFSGRWRDLEPTMAPDGSYMIFASSRPFKGDQAIDGLWNGHVSPASYLCSRSYPACSRYLSIEAAAVTQQLLR